MNMRYALFLFLLFSISCTAKNEDKAMIDPVTVLEGNLDGMFLLNIFDGYFPIPNRFIVSVNKESDAIRFHSRSILELKMLSDSYVNPLIGLITMGPISECKFCRDPNSTEIKMEDVGNTKYIEVKRIRDPLSHYFLFYDEHSYMLVSDDDESYWLRALDVFIKLRDVSKNLKMTGPRSKDFSN